MLWRRAFTSLIRATLSLLFTMQLRYFKGRLSSRMVMLQCLNNSLFWSTVPLQFLALLITMFRSGISITQIWLFLMTPNRTSNRQILVWKKMEKLGLFLNQNFRTLDIHLCQRLGEQVVSLGFQDFMQLERGVTVRYLETSWDMLSQLQAHTLSTNSWQAERSCPLMARMWRTRWIYGFRDTSSQGLLAKLLRILLMFSGVYWWQVTTACSRAAGESCSRQSKVSSNIFLYQSLISPTHAQFVAIVKYSLVSLISRFSLLINSFTLFVKISFTPSLARCMASNVTSNLAISTILLSLSSTFLKSSTRFCLQYILILSRFTGTLEDALMKKLMMLVSNLMGPIFFLRLKILVMFSLIGIRLGSSALSMQNLEFLMSKREKKFSKCLKASSKCG